MPGLTDEERQEILSRRQPQGQSPEAFSPYPGLSLQGLTVGRTPSARFAPDPTQQLIAQRKAQNQYPVLTETERERSPMATGAVQFVDQFAQDLGLTTEDGKPVIRHPEKIAPPLARELVPQRFQDYAMSEESSILYNALESAFQLGSIVLTGRQGDLQKLQQIRDVYTFGAAVKDKPKLAYQRYQNLRKLFQTFDRASTSPPEQRQDMLDQVSQQMDSLLRQTPDTPELDPNISQLQTQFPGATIRRKK